MTRVLAIAFVLLGAAAAFMHAGENHWTTSGPHGESVLSLAIDPVNSANAYAGTQRGAIFRTADFGMSWSEASTGLVQGAPVLSLAIDPLTAASIYAGTQRGLFRSSDASGNWTSVYPETTLALAIDPSRESNVYVAGNAGVARSINGGTTWSGTSLTAEIRDLVIDPQNPSTVYAADYEYYSGSVLFKSTNNGANWAAVSAMPWVNPATLVIDPVQPSTLYVGTYSGVLKSEDSGLTWQPAGTVYTNAGLSDVRALALDPRNPRTVYAGTSSSGVFRSSDAGASWVPFNAGLTNLNVRSLALDPSGTLLHLGTPSGVFEYRISSGPCAPSSDALCLVGNRFQVSLKAFQRRTGRSGSGQAITQGDRYGYFSLPAFTGDSAVPEVVIKMVDGTSMPAPYGGYFWLFYNGLTDLDYTLTVLDTSTGQSKAFRNDPASPACGGADTSTFMNVGSSEEPLSAHSAAPGSFLAPASGPELLLLGNRFRVTMTAVDPRTGQAAVGQAMPQGDAYGYFSLPDFTGDPAFPEVFIKMVDATSVYGSFWVFHTGLTDLQYTMTVTDTVSGAVKTYQNDRSNPAHLCGGADVAAFPQ